MRMFVLVLALVIAAPAAAQPLLGFAQTRDAWTWSDANAARNRDIALTNELAVLQARVQAEQALSNLAVARINPGLPTVPPGSGAPPAIIDVSQLASIPDAELAASNARVRAAADNRR